MTKILAVDDFAVVRAGVRRLLAEHNFLVDEAASAEEAMEKLQCEDWNVVLLDISMPRTGGIELLRRIISAKPSQKIIILSMHPEARYALQMIRAGASGYLQKEAAGTDLINAVKTVLSGKKYVGDEIQHALKEVSYDPKSLHGGLSSRESEIFLMLARGVSVTVIAGQLMLSVKTVSTYRSRVLEKMNMTSNAELMYYAFDNDLIV